MTPQRIILVSLIVAVGASLVLSEFPFARTPTLRRRLRAFLSPVRSRGAQTSVAEVLGPLAAQWGGRLATLLGVRGQLDLRLARVGSQHTPPSFRLRQLGFAAAAFVVAISALAALSAPAPLILAGGLAAPLCAFLLIEQRLVSQCNEWKQQVIHELPVVIEQMGMLVSAGYSLGAAIHRIAARTQSEIGDSMQTVVVRIQQGVGELTALREWAELCDVDSIDRFVSILALNWEASDIGMLISAEAREVRRHVQRQQIELIERRAQQVWIPVTVATLVPGVIFMAVPFADAMAKLTGA